MSRTGNLAKKIIIALTLSLTAVSLPLYAYKVWNKTDYTDFEVYYRAATRVKAGAWSEIYSLADGSSPYRYAPPSLLFFRPLAELDYSQAKLLWFFLQFSWFSLGFYLIYLTLRKLRVREALFVTCFSALFVLRFCLDCFTIGQVSSLLFLGFCLSFYGWVGRKPALAGSGLLLPAGLKIGPGFLYSLFALARPRERIRVMGAALLWVGALALASSFWFGSQDRVLSLWKDWGRIVALDSVYYDASHYGSQSLKSFLLRLVKTGTLDLNQAYTLHADATLIGCLGILAFWAFRRPKNLRGRALFFSLGIFPYLWFMPETFKYSLTPLAIPVAALLMELGKERKNSKLSLEPIQKSLRSEPERNARRAQQKGFSDRLLVFPVFCLILSALSLSLAGKDLIGDSLFFGLQRYSLPFFSFTLLGFAIWQKAWAESEPSRWARDLKSLFVRPSLGPWENFPISASARSGKSPSVSLLIPLPFEDSFSFDPDSIGDFLRSFSIREKTEILLIPYGSRVSRFHPLTPLVEEAVSLSCRSDVQILSPDEGPFAFHSALEGRGAALRRGFLASRGKKIFASHAQQICDASFFLKALELLDQNYDLVRANRRLEQTHFRIPVRLLPLIYSRHRLGLWFNQGLRLLLPLKTTDTHSGCWGMNRKFAEKVFAVQSAADFLFDLELSLVSLAHGCREIDLPVTLNLDFEKSVKRMIYETLMILTGIPRLAWRYRRGCYGPISQTHRITADDWGLSPGINQGILALVRAGVIQRVSLMAHCPFLSEGLEELRNHRNVELGLHFDLTHGKTSPGRWMLKWLNPFQNRKILAKQIQNNLRNQLETLKGYGIKPHFLDGHHHIHLVPGVIDTLAPVIRSHQIGWIRLVADRKLIFTLKAPLFFFSWFARFRLRALGFRFLPCFYPQSAHFRDHGLFRSELARNPEAEVITHPAEVNDFVKHRVPDVYAEQRVLEFKALRMLSFGAPR